MNNDTLSGKWKEIKGDLRKLWGNITDDEWEKTKGDATAISGVLQQRYGYAKDEATQKVSGVMDKYLSKKRDDLGEDKENEELLGKKH
jgi:uncharacterized protein YjbJ (UPF0337 family)